MARTTRERLEPLLLPLLLLVAVFGAYSATAEKQGINTDAYAASAGAWRIATTGTPFFDQLDVTQIAGTHTNVEGENGNGQWLSKSLNGHVTAQRMAGPIIAGVPFYWALSGDGTEESDFSLAPGAIAASAFSAVAVLLIFLALRRQVPVPLALAAALVFAFASPTWSVSANGLWTHPVTQVGIAGAAYAASRSRWVLAGLFLGIGMFGRPHVAVIAAILGLGLAWSRRDWRIALSVALPTCASLGLLAVWNRAVHGAWSIGGAYSGAMDRAAEGVSGDVVDQLVNYVGFLISFDRGFLVWSPIVIVLLPALVRARHSLPDWTIWLALGGVVYTFFQLRLNYFAGGVGFYSYRHGLELLTCLVPALTFSAPFLGRTGRLIAPPVVALQLAAIALGAAIEGAFVSLDDVWTDNGFWLALRHYPALVGTWVAVCVATGLLVAIRYVPDPVTARARPSADDVERSSARA